MIRESRHAEPHVTAGAVPDLTLGAVTVGVGLVMLAIARPVRRGMRGVL